MVLGSLPVPGRLGQGPTALVVGAGGETKQPTNQPPL